jgi:outer membrane protein assembly factor BamB
VGDRLFVGSCAGRFYCLERRTGAVIWSYDITKDGEQTSFHGDPLVAGDLVLVGTDGAGIGHVYAFERATGKVRWKHPVTRATDNGRGLPTDLVRLDSSVFGVALGDELLSLDLETGRLNWSFRSGFPEGQFAWTSTPAARRGRVFFGGLDGVVYALDARRGTVIWKRDLGAAIHSSVTLVGDDLFVGAASGHLYRLRQATGAVVADVDAGATPWGRFLVADSALLLFAGQGGAASLVCIDVARNRVRWSQKPAGVLNTARPYLWRGAVLAGNEGGEMFVYALADGALERTFRIGGGARGVGVSEEALYVGTLEGKLYALDTARDRTRGERGARLWTSERWTRSSTNAGTRTGAVRYVRTENDGRDA